MPFNLYILFFFLQILKKELDTLRTELLQTERNANTARKKYDEEQLLLKGLQQQFRDADAVRQKAYGHWRELKNMLIEKVCCSPFYDFI